MNKALLILFFFLLGCGYQPIYLNKDLKNFEFSKIISEGDNNINLRIINTSSIKENSKKENKNKLIISSSYKVETTSKDVKGQAITFRSTIIINLKIEDLNNNVLQNRNFIKEFTYNSKLTKFDLTEYQNSIKDDLIREIISEIIIFLNTR